MFGGVRAGLLCLRAFRNVKRKNFARAIAQFDAVLRHHSKNPRVLNARGFAYQSLGQYARAFEDFSQAIECDRKFMLPYVNRAISSRFMGELERSMVDLNAALVRDSQHAGAHALLGIISTTLHDYDLAIAKLSTAIALKPKEAEFWSSRGLASFHNGDFSSAAADLRKAISLGGDAYAVLFCFLAEARRGVNASSRLQADLQNLKSAAWPAPVAQLFMGTLSSDALLAAAPKPDDKAEAHFYIGQWHLLRDDRIAAVKVLREAMRSCPANYIERTGAVAELRRLGMTAAAL
jgi:tetratricopeptide (TPR) repeat protein